MPLYRISQEVNWIHVLEMKIDAESEDDAIQKAKSQDTKFKEVDQYVNEIDQYCLDMTAELVKEKI